MNSATKTLNVFLKFKSSFDQESNLQLQVSNLLDFSASYMDTYKTELLPLLEKKVQECINQGLRDEELVLHAMLSYFYFDRGERDKALIHVGHMQQGVHEAKQAWVKARLLNFLSYMHAHQGDFEQALTKAFAAVASFDENDLTQAKGWCLYALAIIHFDLKDYANAEKYFLQTIDFFQKTNVGIGVARSNTGLASVYIHQDRLEEAEKLIRQSLQTYLELEIISGVSRSYNDLGLIFRKQNRLAESLENFNEALVSRRKSRHTQAVVTTIMEMSETLFLMNRHEETLPYLFEARDYCEKVISLSKLYRIYSLLSQAYRNMNEPWKALEYYEKFDQLRTKIMGENSSNKIKELQTKVMTEKAEKEKEIERLRNVELKKAYDIIEQKNKEITDSINYAKRIQYALLAHDELLNENLPEHFIFFQPKDIVSGDFYWATARRAELEGLKFGDLKLNTAPQGNQIPNVKPQTTNLKQSFYLAVCDSTGHGVPGAFMSLLNISFLNEAITEKNITGPAQVLDHARQRLIENISQEGQKDGMDGILVKLDLVAEGQNQKYKIEYAAANNAPVLIRNGQAMELPFDKMPIGKGENNTHFKPQTFEPQTGDLLYLFTDGYADQFGGDKGKKFKSSNLQQLLQEIAPFPLKEQRNMLHQRFEKWKGDLEQVDDVCIIGIRF